MGHAIFISGGTGYIGASLRPLLIERSHTVTVLARPQSTKRVGAGQVLVGDALRSPTFAPAVRGCDTYLHLTGTPHPAPWKKAQFRAVDVVSLRASVEAASTAGVRHFVYLSVAHPAPVMKAYIDVRMECEELLWESGMAASILRPWYVLGPGHRWPVMLKPLYAVAEQIPALRGGARRLGLVTREQMVSAIVTCIEQPPDGVRVVEVPEIRARGAEAPRGLKPALLEKVLDEIHISIIIEIWKCVAAARKTT